MCRSTARAIAAALTLAAPSLPQVVVEVAKSGQQGLLLPDISTLVRAPLKDNDTVFNYAYLHRI